MNGPDLLKELTTVLKESGWLDKATEYMREHPERFIPTSTGNGLINSIRLSVSYQPKNLQEVQNAKPILFTDIGNLCTIMHVYNEYDNGSTRRQTLCNDGIVTEVFKCR